MEGILKLLAISGIIIASLLIFNPFLFFLSLMFSSVLELYIESIEERKILTRFMNMCLPSLSLFSLLIAILASWFYNGLTLSLFLFILTLSLIPAAIKAWEYVGFNQKTLIIFSFLLIIVGSLSGLVFKASSNVRFSPENMFSPVSSGNIIYLIVNLSPWSSIMLTGLVAYSALLIHMVKYIQG